MKTGEIDMPVIDAHLHLWDTVRMNYPWLETAPAIRRPFFIEDYQEAVKGLPVEKMVFVQAECLPEQFLEEVGFVEEQAQKDSRIKGIVAYAPLELGKGVKPVLEILQQHALVKGVRRMYDEKPELCYSSSFIVALQLLPAYGFSFDISIQPHAMAATIRMIGECPDTQFILDHLGKPDIKNGGMDNFKRNIDQLAGFPNIVAKLSGLITAADWKNWTQDDVFPYVAYAISSFGSNRLMFGSDWPVVLLAGTYKTWFDALCRMLQGYKKEDNYNFFYGNAAKIYGV